MKKIVISIWIVLTAGIVFSQRAIPFKINGPVTPGSVPGRSVAAGNQSSLTVSYTFETASIQGIEIEGNEYQLIHVNGFGKLNQIGAPALPMHNDLILLGNGRPRLSITDAEYIEYDDYLIHPALRPARDTEGAAEPEFVLDTALYSTDAFYPEQIVSVTNILRARGRPLASVRICPVQYNPVTKRIRVYSRIEYTIQTGGPLTAEDRRALTVKNRPNYQKFLKQAVLNPASVDDEVQIKKSASVSESESAKNYIIITHSEYQEAAHILATWKRQLGYSVEIVSRSSWTAPEVKDAIHSRYETWTVKPDYFVIIGDHDGPFAVPGEIHQDPEDLENFATDMYYAYVDGAGDYFPDMAHGRISVSNASQAIEVIQKIVDYERNPVNEPSFYSNGVNCAQFQDDDLDGYADRRFCHTSEEIRDYLKFDQGYDVGRIYVTDSEATPTNFNNTFYSDGQSIPEELLRINGFAWDGDQYDILDALNEGRFYIFHRDHGYTGGYGWAHPRFSVYEIPGLSNGSKLPVVFSINCHTGEFQVEECFAEKLLRYEDGGAVGVVAASYYSYSGYNDALSIGMIDAIWPDPGLTPDFGMYGNPNPTSSSSAFRTMGDVVNVGITRMIENWGDNSYANELFHWFGDPAMRIWTKNPYNNQITADIPESVDCATSSIEIINCNIPDALVTLVNNDSILAMTKLSEGCGALNVSGLCATSSQLILTISKENSLPLIKSLKLYGESVTDYDGNSYNTIKIGEQWWMAENLKTTHYADGTPLLDGTGIGEITGEFTEKYWFTYDDNPVNKDIYGLLYTWPAAMNGAPSDNDLPGGVQGVCPSGWHLPSNSEWDILRDYLKTNVGGKLKEAGTLHWLDPNEGATNESGFTALPGGVRGPGSYYFLNQIGNWWSSTEWEDDITRVHRLGLSYGNSGVDITPRWKDESYSVRCIKGDASAAAYEKSFETGWNWFSVNVRSDDMSLDNLFTCASEGDYIKSQTASARYYEGIGWFGSLAETGLDPLSAYKIKVSNPCGAMYSGKAMEESLSPIALVSGWNWITYLPECPMTPNEAFSSLSLQEGDYVKNQSKSSFYYEGIGWFGSMDLMNPKDGYLLKKQAADQLIYPVCSPVESGMKKNLVSELEQEDSFNPHQFEYNGSVTARVYMNGEHAGSNENLLLAYVDEQLRGVTQGMYFEPGTVYVYPLMIYSNVSEGEVITFRYYDAEHEKVYNFNETLNFTQDMIVSDALNSFELHVSEVANKEPGVVTDLYSLSIYPNPFNDRINIEYRIIEPSQVRIEIVDCSGRTILNHDEGIKNPGTYDTLWSSESYPEGLYLLKITTGNRTSYRKIILRR